MFIKVKMIVLASAYQDVFLAKCLLDIPCFPCNSSVQWEFESNSKKVVQFRAETRNYCNEYRSDWTHFQWFCWMLLQTYAIVIYMVISARVIDLPQILSWQSSCPEFEVTNPDKRNKNGCSHLSSFGVLSENVHN